MSFFTRPLQAFTLASALTMGAPLGLTACSNSSRPTDESSTVTTGSTVTTSGALPPPSSRVTGTPVQLLSNDPQAVLAGRGNSGSATIWQLLAALGALTTAGLTYAHWKLRKDQAYAQKRAIGLTLEGDVKDIERRLSESAGNRDHWSHEFLTDLRKVARNGLLRPARCRTEDILDLMNLRNRSLPVINTVVAPSGAGKSRMVEGLVYSLYHDKSGYHFEHPNYNPRERLFPDIDPAKLLCYRINLGQLTHADAEPMFHHLMRKADECARGGGRCLVIIDDVHYLYRPNGFASASRLIHLIDGWTDGQMKDNKGLWGIAMTPLAVYEELFAPNASRARRFERYDMTVFSGGRLRSVVDETLGEWETRLQIKIPEPVRDRAMELMLHDNNKMANPYALLNLLDRVASGMTPGQTMTIASLNQSFARLHRLSPNEVALWSIYKDVERSILEELKARFGTVSTMPPHFLPSLANIILGLWKSGDQRLGHQKQVSETYIVSGLKGMYDAIAQQPARLDAHALMSAMKKEDKGSRAQRSANVSHLRSPDMATDHRAAANG